MDSHDPHITIRYQTIIKTIVFLVKCMSGIPNIVRTENNTLKVYDINMDNDPSKRRTFTHFHYCIDADEYKWVFILVELLDGAAVASYVVPITKPYLKCFIYPYIRN
jgi:hypothetical protein